MDKRLAVWEKLPIEKKIQWVKSGKDPMMTLACQANYSYEVWARPMGSEKQTFQAQADDFDLQRELNLVIKTEIDDPFCYSVALCQQVADRELAIVMAQRQRCQFQKITHLQDEIGDVVTILHPYTQQSMNVFITTLTRTYTKPEGTSQDGGVIDQIQGWRV